MKTCATCGETKPLDAFSKHPKCKDGRFPYCKTCRAARGRADYQANREAILAKQRKRREGRREEQRAYDFVRALRRKYGLTKADYDALVAAQKGRCAICGRETDPLHVDHCHETGGVRGLLCKICNVGLGSFHDDVERLRRAAEYLERWQSPVDRSRLESGRP